MQTENPKVSYMVDIETWGTRSWSAPIVAIGATKFDPQGSGTLSQFEVSIDPSQAPYGRVIEPDTLTDFWMKPEQRAALDYWRGQPKVSLPEALIGLISWIGWHWAATERRAFWANDPDFDMVALTSAFAGLGLGDPPWSFRDYRSMRTLRVVAETLLPGRLVYDLPPTLAHSALGDAIRQTWIVQEQIRKVWALQQPPEPVIASAVATAEGVAQG